MLSGVSNDLLLTHSFHGTIIAWARQAQMFHIKDSSISAHSTNPSELEAAWKQWAQAEETVRLILGLYVHDSEFTTVFHTESFLRPDNDKLPRCCSDELFAAPTAAMWKSILDQQSVHSSPEPPSRNRRNRERALAPLSSSSQLQSYVQLCTIMVSLCEAQSSSSENISVPVFAKPLLGWWDARPSRSIDSRDDPFCLAVLWHEAFVLTYSNIDMLEQAVGRDGTAAAQDKLEDAVSWAATPEARRCVLHATLATRGIEGCSVRFEPAIHVPKSLFHAGLVIYSFLKFAPAQVEYSEFQPGEFSSLPGLNSSRACWTALQTIDFSALSTVIGLLSRIGHWEICRKYAAILEALADDLVAVPTN